MFGDQNFFVVGVECYFVMVDFKEVEGIKILFILFVFKEELEDKVKEFEEKFKVVKYVEMFKDQIYGWMVVRSDLSDVRVKEEYIRGYKMVLDFFVKNWKV